MIRVAAARRGRNSGFTLIELMVVVAIVAILLAMVLPGYQRHLLKTRRALAVAELLELTMRQEQFFLEHKRYALLFTDLGLPYSPYAIDVEGNAVPAGDPDRIYLIESSWVDDQYTFHARPQLSQVSDSRCGTLSIQATGIKLSVGAGTNRECW